MSRAASQLTIDRTPMDAAEILLTGLPISPSLNNAYVNVIGGGRRKSARYMTWRNACGWEVKAQRPRKVSGPVSLTYTFEEGGTKADLGNLEKCVTDLLVDLGLIDGDGPDVVRSIKLQWGKVQGLMVEVRAA